MAQKYVPELVDDLDGSRAMYTVRFGLDDVNYVIDLSGHNVGALRSVLEPYVSAARTTDGSAKTSTVPRVTRLAPAYDLSAVRRWAKANGHAVSRRGRVPGAVLGAYEAAH